MLNRLNKRYRSCIDCVTRQRKYRQNLNSKNDISNNINSHGVLATLDKEEDETFNIEPSTNLIDYPNIEQKQEPCYHKEPNIDISNLCTYESNHNFYSWRRSKTYLRQWNFISS